eukprot:m.123071 g.123071  ORF g.123071 m.123071 type:complete len:82 (-) comp13742_c3_seq1:285-530(-)
MSTLVVLALVIVVADDNAVVGFKCLYRHSAKPDLLTASIQMRVCVCVSRHTLSGQPLHSCFASEFHTIFFSISLSLSPAFE